jgi:Domain of unknown function (DUF4383)
MTTSAATAGHAHASDRTPAQMFAYLIGAILVAAGVLGFFWDTGFDTGSAIQGDKVLGILEVNGIHNIIHILSGVALLAVAPSRGAARIGVIAFGAVYAVVTLVGLVDGETVLGLIPVNGPDNVLHTILALGALFIGLTSRSI